MARMNRPRPNPTLDQLAAKAARWVNDSVSTDRRPIDGQDVDGWMSAANKRRSIRSREDVIRRLNEINSFRMWRLRHDMRWLEKQLLKMGLNPDDAMDFLRG